MHRRISGLKSQLQGLVGAPHCLLCAGASTDLVCQGCRGELPWNRSACSGCARPLPHGGLCAACLRRAPPYEAALSAFRYAAPVDRAIHGLKYHADFLSARWLGQALAEAAGSRPAPDCLLPVPLHHARLRRRGYNQAHELARVAGRRLGLAVEPGLARRIRATADQIGKTAAERRRNLRGAFAVEPAVQGRRVALVDDVMTTGSTLAALARACRAAGALTVEVWVVARAE